ncbi:36636_t:CDS:1, partial [Racocetra persica]
YWEHVCTASRPSLLGFLKYRKSKIVDPLNKDEEHSLYLDSLKVIGSHYTTGVNFQIVDAVISKLK